MVGGPAMSTNQTIAGIIHHQLGGRKFDVMTGAKDFVRGNNWLAFRIPMSKGINHVRITLLPSDVYIMQFFKARGAKVNEIVCRTYVYADQLQAVFSEVTGLATKL
jgi:hypothetical protein